MYLTPDEVFSLPAESYASASTLIEAVSRRWSVGISPETACRIIADYANYLDAK